MAHKSHLTWALMGNPNCGKTTLFNNLTQSNHKTGNYSGVTVTTKEGRLIASHHGQNITIIDVPGIYSLAHPIAPEEKVAYDALHQSNLDGIIYVADANHLEQSMGLFAEATRLNLPMILVLNMIDEVKSRNEDIDAIALSNRLGIPVVECCAHCKKDVANVINLLQHGDIDPVDDPFECPTPSEFNLETVKFYDTKKQEWVSEALKDVFSINRDGFIPLTFFDKLAIHPFWGIVFFAALMYGVFELTFTLGGPLVDYLDGLFGEFAEWTTTGMNDESLWKALITDGIFGGVGAVISFLPTILILFILLAILESTGYMSRAAYLFDGYMRKMHLSGKSIIPMIVGFGCNVPAIMATRSIESEHDRLTTIFVLPLMSCAARLPIYILFIGALIPDAYQGLTMFALYAFGIVLALSIALCIRKTKLSGAAHHFLLDVPPMRLPRVKHIILDITEKAKSYIVKAGTIILGASCILWVLNTFPLEQNEETPSYAEQIGQVMEPVTQYAGMDANINTAVLAAVAAKELVVAQVAQQFKITEENAQADTQTELSSALNAEKEESEEEIEADDPRLLTAIQGHFNIAQALSIMVFCLIALPCMATFAVSYQETKSWKFALGQYLGLTAMGFVFAVITYQITLTLI